MRNVKSGVQKEGTRAPGRHCSLFTAHCSLFIVVLFTTMISGCGYRNPYVQPKNGAPLSAKRVFLSIWPNRTNELGLETVIYRNLVTWFQQSPKITITPNKDEADYLLTGEIRSISLPALSYGQFDQAVEVNVILTVSYQLTEKATGRILLAKNDLTFTEAAKVGTDASTTRGNKNGALTIINDDLAELVYLDTVSQLFPL
jgi:hypothetical protein